MFSIDNLIELHTFSTPEKIEDKLDKADWEFANSRSFTPLNNTYSWYRTKKLQKPIAHNKIERLDFIFFPEFDGYALIYSVPGQNVFNQYQTEAGSRFMKTGSSTYLTDAVIHQYQTQSKAMKVGLVNGNTVIIVVNLSDFEEGLDIN